MPVRVEGATRTRRRVWASVVLAVIAALVLQPVPAQALTSRPMTLTYNQIVNGDYRMIGNGVLACDPTKPIFPGTNFTCTQLHNGTSQTNLLNDFKWMGNVDVDGNAATANSSQATVTIPAGASVVKAILYWSGNTGEYKLPSGSMSTTKVCSSNAPPAGGAPVAPAGDPSARSVTVGFGATSFTAAPTKYTVEAPAALASGNPQYYTAQADVTAQFAALPNGSSQTITVGNLWAMQGFGCYAGWSLALVYDFGDFDPNNAALTNAREIFLYDGHIRKQAADPTAEVVPFSGFTVEGPGSRAGFTLYEGDRNITGDFANYQSNSAASPTQIQNALGGLGNIGISMAEGSVSYVSGVTTGFVNADVDVRNTNLPQLTTGDTSMNLSLDTSGDSFLLQNALLSVPTAAIKIDKSFNGTLDEQTVALGGTPTFTIRVSNAGEVALKNVFVTDALAPNCARTIGTLGIPPAANSVVTYTCTGNPATAAFTNEAIVDSRSDLDGAFGDSDTTIVHVPRIDVTKTASPTIVAPGGSTTWTITVTNIGDEPLSNVATTDAQVPACARPSLGTLAVGASTTYTCTSTGITSGFTNSVRATGNSPLGVGAVASDTATADVKVRNLSITKSVTPTTRTAAGQSVTYSFVVTNTGEVPLSGIAVTDVPTAPAGTPTVSCPATTLAAGASTTCTATYVLTQADVDKGTVVDTAQVVGTDTGGATVTANSNTATVTITPAPALTVVKSANPTTVTAAGQSVNYSFLVTNTGNVTLSGVSVTDVLTAPAAPTPTVTCPSGALAPGASVTCTASYVATQADIDAGSIRNSATASGTPPTGPAVTSPPSPATVTATPAPAITLTKSIVSISDNNNDGLTDVGDGVLYSFAVRNTGNVTLSSVTITDPDLAGLTITCAATTLAPGASTTCTPSGPYVVTADDVLSGAVANTATVQGTPPGGAAPVSATSSTTTPATLPAGGLTITKSASPTTFTATGQTVTYSFVVTNTGNVPLSNVAVTDTFTTGGTGTASAISCPSTTLARGAAMTCTGTYLTNQADIDAGRIVNSATAAATAPGGIPINANPATATVTGPAAEPAVTVVKTASPTTITAAGQTVNYSFAVTNTGNVTLTSVAVTDVHVAPATAVTVVCPTTTLAPGAATTCTASYVATQQDLDAGSIKDTATAAGTAPNGDPITSEPSSATVTATPNGSLTVVKSASPSTVSAVGESVSYSFVVTNTGNVTLSGVSVTDTATAPATAVAVTCSPTTLAPAASVTCTGSYTVTQADLDAGTIADSATASGTTPAGATVTSPPSPATVTAEALPALTVDKSAAPTTVSAAGDTVDYSFVVTNTGNVTLTGVSVADTATPPATAVSVSCPETTLAPGASVTCTASYAATQADIDHGSIVDSATASGTPPSGPQVTSDPSSATVTADPDPSLSLVKSASPATVSAVGQVVTYTFALENTGNVTLSDLAVADVQVAPSGAVTVTCAATTLAPGGTTTCTGSYSATQEDLDAGSIQDTATASGTTPAGAPVESNDSSAVVGVDEAGTLVLTKTADRTTVSAVGDVVSYEFLVENTGNVTLSNLSVTDTPTAPAGPVSVTCPVAELAPAASTTCTGTYTVTQADLDAGTIHDSAVAQGNTPQAVAVESDPSEATVGVDATRSLTIVKTADPTTVSAVGDVVTYTFVVQNTGNVTISAVAVTDTPTAPAGPVSVTCPDSVLAPGDSTTCTGTYLTTQEDLDNGTIDDSAVATGTAPGGVPVTSEPSTASVTAEALPALTVLKVASPTTVTAANQPVDYTFTVQNTGNVTVSDVAVTDTLTAPAGPELSVSCPDTTLSPQESVSCTASYTVTQADVDAGSIVNSATASGSDPAGEPVPPSEPSTATVDVDQQPSLTLVKSADPQTVAAAGDVVEYTFVVTNTGNVTVSDVAVTDTLTAPAGPELSVSCPDTTLSPQESVSCTASYTVTQADVDAGSIVNSATASGSDPAGGPVPPSEPSTATVDVDQQPSVSVVKSADPVTVSAVGDVVEYTFVVTNTGNVTVSDVVVTDVATAPATAVSVSCPVTVLAPSESTSCTGSYTVTQADLDAGSIVDSATASGSDPAGEPVPPSEPSTATVDVDQQPSVSVVKSADPVTVSAVGDVVEYTFVVTNTGNVTVSDVAVTDTLTAPAGPELVVFCPVTVLAPSESTSCTASYTVTLADMDAGSIVNSATASGSDPAGGPVPPSEPSTATVDVDQQPSVSVVKSADPVTVSAVGDVVEYTFVVTNTGNVTVSDVVVTDVATAPATAVSVSCPVTVLAPSESTSCTGSYTVTQADLDAGSIVDSATASGSDPAGEPVPPSEPSTATVDVDQQPSLTLVKSADPQTVAAAGDVVEYTFVVTNTGNVTVSDVAVTDTLTAPAGPELSVSCPDTTLSPQESVSCTASYTVTQADVDAGSIVNSATASGSDPAGEPVPPSEPSTATVDVDQQPSVSVVKSADPVTVSAVGDVVEYTFVVTNTGNVTVSDVAVTDTLTAPAGPELVVFCPVTVLAPSESTSCTGSYTVTQADLDAGSIVNSATASGSDPAGEPVPPSEPSTATVDVDQQPSVSVVKSADPVTVSAVGDVVEYTFVVTNTGNVTVSDVAVTDTLTAPAGPELVVFCPVTVLAPSESTSCTASYTVTLADMDAGSIVNSATASGSDPAGGPVPPSEPSTATVDVDQQPSVSVVKSADPVTVSAVGDVVEYTFVVTNTGNVTVSDVVVTDVATAPATAVSVSCPVTVLAPSESTSCTGSYTVTQADLDAGSIVDSATASGSDPAGEPVPPSEPSTATVDVDQQPSLTLVKSADPQTVAAAGDVVEYTFVVTNTGNVTVSDVAVTDTLTAPAGPELSVSCPDTTLSPQESVSCTASYTVTQADADHGWIDNSATASALSPDESPVSSEPSTARVQVTQVASLDLVKSADPTTVEAAGASVTYSFLVTNTGNVSITGLTVTDVFTAPAGPEITVACPDTDLAPAEQVTCTANYTVTQADADQGVIFNQAEAAGTSPGGDDVRSVPSVASVDVIQRPGLTIDKSADPEVIDASGATVGYTFVVTNTGNVTVRNLTVADTLTAPAGPELTVTCPATELAPGASTTCTASYVATQADVDKGAIENSAVAEGDYSCRVQARLSSAAAADEPSPCPVTSAPDTAMVTVDRVAALELDKQAEGPIDKNGNGRADAGDVIRYSFVVTNTGNVTQTDIEVSDPLVDPVSCPGSSLAPGESMTCGPVDYVITAADQKAEHVVNHATVDGVPPDGVDPSPGEDDTDTPVDPVLPVTGSDVSSWVRSSSMLVGLGLVFILGSRGRGRHRRT